MLARYCSVNGTCMVKSYIKSCEELGNAFNLQECLMWANHQEDYDAILSMVAKDRIAACERKQRLAEAKAQGLQLSFLYDVANQDPSESRSPKYEIMFLLLNCNLAIRLIAVTVLHAPWSRPQNWRKSARRFCLCPSPNAVPSRSNASSGMARSTSTAQCV